MSPQITWSEIALRLFLTVLAGTLVGINRGEHGHPAGLRTTLLVCLAASLAMVQVNLLLDVSGKSDSSFVVMDLMRLPLGILSGMGFIGGGVILRKGNLITGVTTAATLWFVTVVGLCLGGGQLALGMIALALGLGVLWGVKAIEEHWTQVHVGTLTVVSRDNGPDEFQILEQVAAGGGKLTGWSKLSYQKTDGCREHTSRVTWKICPSRPQPPPFLQTLSKTPGVVQVDWEI